MQLCDVVGSMNCWNSWSRSGAVMELMLMTEVLLIFLFGSCSSLLLGRMGLGIALRLAPGGTSYPTYASYIDIYNEKHTLHSERCVMHLSLALTHK